MATPKWFDYAAYKANKLTQMQQLDSSYNMTKLEKAFTDAGFEGADGYYKHFQKYGHKEDVSPNKLFNADYYYKAKAIQFYSTEGVGTLDKALVLDRIDYYAQEVKGLINNAGMDAWTHYIKYGTKEGINPSNDFDTSAYMAAKLAAMGSGWTAESLAAAFKKANLNALEHFMVYAGNGKTGEVTEGLGADGSVPAAYAVPEAEQIDDDPSHSGTVFTLTAGTTVLTSNANVNVTPAGQYLSSADDTVNAFSLLNAADTIQDPSSTDKDVLNVSVNAPGTTGNIANIETINLDFVDTAGAGTFGLASVTGAKTIAMTMTNNGALTGVAPTSASPTIALVGGSKTATVELTTDNGTADVLNVQAKAFSGGLTIDSAVAGAANTVLETLNIETTGDAASSLQLAVDGVNVTQIADVKVSGSQDVTFVAKADNILSQTVLGTAGAIAKIEKADGFTGKVNLLLQGDNANLTDAQMSLKDYAVDGLTLGATGNHHAVAATFTVNDASSGLTVNLINGAATSFTVAADSAATRGTSDNLTLNVGGAETALAALEVNNFEHVTINQGSTKALTITALNHDNNPSATDVLTITGEKNLTVAQANLGFDTLDASGFSGKLTMTGANQADLNSVTGGSGNDTLVIGKYGAEAFGGAGNDTIEGKAPAAPSNVLTMEMTGGAGNDEFIVTNIKTLAHDATAKFVTIKDFGTGSDVLKALAVVHDVAESEEDFSTITASSTDADVFAILAGTAAAAANDVAYYNINGATYLWQASGAAALGDADILVKLVGFDGDLKANDAGDAIVIDA